MESVVEADKPQVFHGMEHTPEIAKLTEALSKFQGECEVIIKDKANPFLKSLYADLGSILRVVNPLLGKHGLAVLQMPVGADGDLITMVCHSSGEWIRFRYRMKPVKSDPQSIGSSLTYQKRYALVAALNLPIDDEDDDGQAGSQRELSPGEVLRKNLGELMRSHTPVGRDELLKQAGLCKSADLAKKDDDYLRKAYAVLGGDERLAAIRK